jgi:hypothetical protein
MTWAGTFLKLNFAERGIARQLLGRWREPDLTIAPDGNPYLYRWHLVRSKVANVYMHLQVASDPERPLHDHPWHNQSVILAGGYDEVIGFGLMLSPKPPRRQETFVRRPGDVISRSAETSHRLVINPNRATYALTLFTTGPKIREWGFWYPTGWVHNEDVTRTIDGISIHVDGSDAQRKDDQ